ncbi:MAG TPA: glucuronate isomerase [Sediminibacterium sp.]|nr:glucuronate isomerase [Sediminibacterium sp.]
MKDVFIHDNFLLQNKAAQKLYHDYARDLPIIDYHCHLPPQEIAENRQFRNMTDIWLRGDHYKWRAMRTLGVPENLITGDATDLEKFRAWAKVLPETIRNPLFHWSQLELQRVFGITAYLNESSADAVYTDCNRQLEQPSHTARGLLNFFQVAYIGTTDEPWDSLSFHRQLAAENYSIRVMPSFRPDKLLQAGNRDAYFSYLDLLEKACGIEIRDIPSLLSAMHKRIAYFHEHGCRVSDHGLNNMPRIGGMSQALENEFKDFVRDRNKDFSDPESLMGYLLTELCRMYHDKGWVQQFHLGPVRNNNSRMSRLLGADSGFDSIGDFPQAQQMAAFFDNLDQTDQLSRTIIYNINPADNEVFATMLGNFNDGSIRGKMQFGSGWWFLDQKDGMEKQLNALSNMGLISTFIGMITDSRSFLSFPRHEYFRRTLCNLLGMEMEQGILPNDMEWIGDMVRRICYYNAKEYFQL